MSTTRIAAIVAWSFLVLFGCAAPATQTDPKPAPGGSSTLPKCRWVPVAPDTDDRCNAGTAGLEVNSTQRGSMRAEDMKTQKSTCVCD